MSKPIDDFRRAAHQMVDWIADYLDNPRDLPVLPNMQPGDLAKRLPRSAPAEWRAHAGDSRGLS